MRSNYLISRKFHMDAKCKHHPMQDLAQMMMLMLMLMKVLTTPNWQPSTHTVFSGGASLALAPPYNW